MKTKTSKIIGILGLIIILSLIICSAVTSIVGIYKVRKLETPKTTDTIIVEQTFHGYYYEIYNLIHRLNIQHPDIVFAQCLIETGNLESNLWYENNNLFGMKVALQRPCMAVNKRGYAHYATWEDSIIDYALWQSKYATNLTDEQYYKILESYAEDPSYAKKIREKVKEIPIYLNL